MTTPTVSLFCFSLLSLVISPGEGAAMGDLGCNHDGRRYEIGETVIVDCDKCTCEIGKIHCPPNPTCPRKCHYKEQAHEHGSKWVNPETCDECTCDDGTVSCVIKECPDSCEVNGLYYKKGEIVLKHCEKCECLGKDKLECVEHFCPCNINDEFVQHGETRVDYHDIHGPIIYRCDDGKLAIEKDNRSG